MITVHMTTFRRLQFGLLRRAVESVLAQSYEDFEFVICDDASTDGTQEYLQSIASIDRRVKVIRNPRNVNSVAISLGRCLKHADTKRRFVTWMFDDCTLECNALRILSNTLERANIDFAFGITRVHNKDGSLLLVGDKPISSIRRDVATSSILVPNAGILVNRSVFDRVGWYDSNIVLRRSCDWDLFRRMIGMNCSYDSIDTVLADEYGPLQSDSLRNSFTTTFDIMLKFARLRDAAHVNLSIDACLNGPIDFIPPGNWSTDELALMYAMFIEYYMSVGNLSRAYVWATKLGCLLPNKPFFFDTLMNEVNSPNTTQSLMAAGALAAGSYWVYKETRGS